MSRELLKRAVQELDSFWFTFDEDGKASPTYALIKEIEAELAKPDPEPEPEPVAWIDKVNFEMLPDKDWLLKCYVQNAPDDKKNIPLYAEQPDQAAQIAALKHEIQQADEDYVSVEEAYLQCQKDLYDETEKLAALQSKREPLTDDQVREVYRTAFPKGPYIYTKDALVFARMIEKAHGIGEII